MRTCGDLTLGDLNGVPVTVDDLISVLEKRDPTEIIKPASGDKEAVTVTDFLRSLHRMSVTPKPVPVEERLPDDEWAQQIVEGKAPYGRCLECGAAKGAVGCLNLCDRPSGMVKDFQAGLMGHLNKQRGMIHWMESLGGCTCGPPNLFGYAIERDYHDRGCPFTAEAHEL